MHHLARRGFTLIELMIALVLLGIVSAGIYAVLVGNQRTFQAQTQRMDLQQNLRAAAAILATELHVLDANDGDIIGMSSDSIRIRAMRVFGIICDAPVLGGPITGRTFTVRRAMTYGPRAFTVGDSVFIYYEGDPSARSDDGWVIGRVSGVAALNCTDGNAGTQLTADLAPFVPPQLNKVGMIPTGAPVWAFEQVTYKVYQAPDGNWYLGMRTAASGIQPLIGPVIGSTGITLSYFDTTGAVTSVPANVAQVEIRVRGRTAAPVRQADGTLGYQVDSILTRVALRNNRRW